MSAMNNSSSIAQRTRARKMQHLLQMVEKERGPSTPRQAAKKQMSSSGKAVAISQMKETHTKKRNLDKMMSPTGGRMIISDQKKRREGLKNRCGGDEDDIEELGEIFVGQSNQVEDDIKLPVENVVEEEKARDVILIDDSLSDEVEAEENATGNSGFDDKKNPKISISTPGSSYFPKEDDDMVILGEEKGHDPGVLFKGKTGSKQNTNEIDKGTEKYPKISKNIAQSSSFLEEEGMDSEDQSQTKTAEGIDICESEDSTKSIGQESDSTDSSGTEDDDSCDADFDIEKYNSSSSLDSLSSYAEENDEDYYPSNELSEQKREEKTTEKGTASYCVLKSSSENDDKVRSTGKHNDSVYNRGRSPSGSKDIGFDRSEVKEMETSGGSSQNRGFFAQESSDELAVARVILKGGEGENLNLGNNGIDETEGMEEEISKKGRKLPKSTPIKPLAIEENRKGERANSPHLKQELTDMKRKKTFLSASTNGTECTKFCPESGALSHNMNTNVVDTRVSERKVTVGKDEANESNLAKKATRNKPNVGGQIEESVTERRYSMLMRQQKYHSSTSLDEGRNNSKFKDLSGKQSEDNHAKKATRNKPNAGAAIKDPVTKRRDSVLSRQQKCHSSTGLDEGRKVCNPFKNLSEKQSEEKICSKEDENIWFTEKKQVYVKKDKDFFKVLADAILREEEEEVLREAPIQQQAKPSSSIGYSLPLKFRFEHEEPKLPEKSDYEIMVAGLFSELENHWTYESMNTFDFTKVHCKSAEVSSSEANQISSCTEGKHDLVRNEEIGDICRRCHCVVNEIRHILPDFAKNATRGSKNGYAEKEHFSVLDGLDISSTMENLKDLCRRTEGTVWNIMPGLRESLYKHQQDGFEFLWKNLAGTTDLTELKNIDSKDVGGCIISHAPGTGKTRLSIVFVQSYLRLFPDSRPVIIAPASMLLTWEEEFKKWNVEFPFHNLCNPEFSGKESKDLLKLFTSSRSQDNNKVRWVKVFTWRKEKSILGISYNLYEKLAGEKVAVDEESENLRRILLQLPKLVVLDEGHIPRNQSSSIWRTLLKLQTEKRVILSGTPFQNNFDELFNTLHLVRPGILEKEKSFAGMVSSRRRYPRKQRGVKEFSIHDSRSKDVDDKAIEKLKDIMEPFVHVHKGSILQQSLPGLVDCVILLDPQPLQKSLIKKIEYTESSFEHGYKVALLSVHPSLVEHFWSFEYENSEVNQNMLKELRLDSEVGVKTKFIKALIQFSTTVNEKVLIFSQYIHPLELIKDQLKANFDWHEGKEVLQMQGKQDQLQRQSIISIFNNPNSEAKVLLAATRCCSEGISLVGASRVVLLDVVWNPSVERQAISRAYRLGQTKVVYTYHLITSGTNEGDKYCRQAEKDRLSELVFSSAPSENEEPRVPTTTFEDRILAKMVNHAQLKDMFRKIISKPKEANLIETFGLVSPA